MALQTKLNAQQLEYVYEKLIETIPDAVSVFDFEGNILLINRSGIDMFGYETIEEIQRAGTIFVTVAPEDRERIPGDIQELVQKGTLRNLEYGGIRKDGSRLDMELSGSLITDADGNPLAILTLSKDITERKQDEGALRQEKALSDAIINSMPGVFQMFDPQGYAIRWNKEFERVSGYSAEEIPQLSVNAEASIIVEEERELIRSKMVQAFQAGSVAVEAHLLTKSGEKIPYYYAASPVLFDGKPYLVSVAYDISDRKRAEAAMLQEKAFSDAIIESLPGTFSMFSAEGRIVRWNKEYEHLTGYSAEEIPHLDVKTSRSVIPEEEKAAVTSEMIKTFQQGRGSLEMHFLTKSGEKVPVYSMGVRVIIDGKPYIVNLAFDITDRRRAEAELLQEKALSDAIINSLPGIFNMFDAEGQMTRWNKEYERITGYSADEIMQLPLLGLVPTEEKERAMAAMGQLLQTGLPVSVELHQICKSGEKLPIYFSGTRVMIGDKAYVVTTGIDMTDRKRAEAAVLQEKALSDAIINSLPGIFNMFDTEGEMIRWNKEYERITGYSADEIMQLPLLGLVPADEKERAMGAMGQLLQTGLPMSVDLHQICKNGERIPMYFSAARAMIGDKAYVVTTGIDMTERKRAEAAVLQEKALSDAIINSLPGIFFMFDAEGNTVRWNAQYEKVMGYTPDEIRTAPLLAFIPDEEKERLGRLAMDLFQNGTPVETESPTVVKSGKRIHLYYSATRVMLDGKPYLAGMGVDITERKQAEEERARLQQQIIEAQKLAIQELSTPIIPIMDRIIVLPLIGTVDSLRARDITRTLLRGITQYRAKVVIMDITGVPLVDSGVAAHLDKAVQAARLKGARTIITGVSDAVAETIIDLGIDWQEIETLRDLQTGLAAALRSLGFSLGKAAH